MSSQDYLLADQPSELERLQLQSLVWEPGGLRVPLQFATALEPRLLSFVTADELEQLRSDGEAELKEPDRWGTTFMLLQCWGRVA